MGIKACYPAEPFASMGRRRWPQPALIGGRSIHASIRTTQRYAHLVDQAQRDAVERIGTDLARAVGGESVARGRNKGAGRARDQA
jgi:hypothetical protein